MKFHARSEQALTKGSFKFWGATLLCSRSVHRDLCVSFRMGGVCSSNQSVHVRSSKDANTENKGEKKVPKSSLRKQKKPSSNGGVPGHVVVADAHIAVVRDLWRRLKPREQQIGARVSTVP